MTDHTKIIEAIDLGRTYQLGSETIVAVDSVNMEVHPGEFIGTMDRHRSLFGQPLLGNSKVRRSAVLSFHRLDLFSRQHRKRSQEIAGIVISRVDPELVERVWTGAIR